MGSISEKTWTLCPLTSMPPSTFLIEPWNCPDHIRDLYLTVDRVVLEQVHKIVDIHEGVIDGSDSGDAALVVHGRSENKSSDSSESIDTNLHS